MLAAMSQEILIRPAELRDVPGMADLRARGSQDAAFWIDRISRYLRCEYHPQQALPPRAAWVAIEHERVIGFVAGHCTQRFGCAAELQWIDVLSEARGRGIAGRLLDIMLQWFREQNAARVCVNVAPENEPARRLYAKYGAVVMNAHWMLWAELESDPFAH
jgi:ribosomal protein S18 acetylase RimI-like enzyme